MHDIPESEAIRLKMKLDEANKIIADLEKGLAREAEARVEAQHRLESYESSLHKLTQENSFLRGKIEAYESMFVPRRRSKVTS